MAAGKTSKRALRMAPIRVHNLSLAMLWCLLLFSLICGTHGQDGQSCSGFWEIGEPQPLSCANKNLTDVMTLQMKVNNTFVDVSSCKLLGKECTDNFAPVYTTIYFDPVVFNGENFYGMTVLISGTRKNETTFRCVVDGLPTAPLCFEMYAIPAKPECDPPTMVKSKSQLNITCTSDRVYPDAFIGILALHGGQIYPPGDYKIEFNTSLSPSLENPGYYVNTVTSLISLSTIEPGTYQFLVSMYPVISNTTVATAISSEVTEIETVVLTAPVVGLSSDCPVDIYVTSGRCTCDLTTAGNPPGQARWYTQSGQVVRSVDNKERSSTLMFSQESSASYECRAETVLNVTSPSIVTFAPKLPSGPNSVTIESSVTDGIFNLCPSEEYITISLTCKVSTEDVKPGVTLTILVNNNIVVDQQDAKITDSHYYHDYSFRPAKGGSYSAECRAQNSISSQQSPSKMLTFEVREPPPSSPVFHIPPNEPGSEVANVVQGKTIDVTCKVDGGYRKVSDVTVTCGSKGQQVQGNIGTLTLEVTQSMDGQICYCSATHDSGCYDKESQVLLKVVSEDAEASTDDKGPDLNQILIIVLPIIAAVVIIVLVVVIIVLFMRKRRRNPAPPKNDDTGLYTEPYSVQQDGYITPRPPASTDYASVIGTDDSSFRWDVSYDNPTFTASNDYDRVSDIFTSTSVH